jgi:hypothetical protein
MSSISVLQAPGPGQVATVKPTHNVSSPPPSTTTAGIAADTGSLPQYHSPQLEIDPLLNQVIIEFRDGQNGAPQYQVPSKAQLLLYQGTQAPAATTAGTGKSRAV